MLFLYTLLFFVLGTSLATVTPPESSQLHISQHEQQEQHEQKVPLSTFPVPERTNLFERINGVWICKDHIMKIEKEAIAGLWDRLNQKLVTLERDLHLLLSTTKWSRATVQEIGSNWKGSPLPQFASGESKDILSTSWVSGPIKYYGSPYKLYSIAVLLQVSGAGRWKKLPKDVPLRVRLVTKPAS
ncbi:hypothetical protein F5887DRAFT_104874 [Amanita rubescens]|nr:hypothetical protein F5887DRAFT_104874 [Amanita rubescens]